MGDVKRRQVSDKQFLSAYNECAYCGQAPVCVDHFPPRSAFEGRCWPDSYRFPSCLACNAQERHDEMVVACLASLPLEEKADVERQKRLIIGLRNNRPDILDEWCAETTRNDVRRRLREVFGDEKGDKFRNVGLDLIMLGPKTESCMRAFGQKLFKALYFRHFGARVTGSVFSQWASTVEHRDAIGIAVGAAPKFQETTRNSVSLSAQFSYRFHIAQNPDFLFAVVKLGPQLVYVGQAMSIELCDQLQKENPEWKRDLITRYNSPLRRGNSLATLDSSL